MKVLLDTSVYSQPIRRNPLPSVIARWKAGKESDYAVSAICELELLYGIKLSGSAQLERVWEDILRGRFPVLPFDADCAACYASLQAAFVRAGNIRPAFDLMIAATALTNNLELVTCNPRDFDDIPNLRVTDWSR